MRRIELVVFDLAGTTVQDEGNVLHCLVAAAERHGLQAAPDRVNALMGRNKLEVFRTLLAESHPQKDEEAREAEAQAIHATYQAMMVEYYRHHCRPVEGAEECFRALRQRGVKIATDTGFGRSITDAIMECLGWRGRYVDADVCVDDVPGQIGRPAPYMLFRAMERTGVTSVHRVAKVGDTPVDLQEGINAGCALVVGVLSGSFTAEELGRTAHTHLLPSVKDLPDLLDQDKA